MQHRATNFASAAFFVTSLALASDTWILDSSRSNARLFQGAGANSELVDSGVARLTGRVKLDTNNLDASFFDLTIYPADEGWEHALNPEGILPTIYAPRATNRSLLTFKSSSILGTGNGTVEVIGNLTLSRVERTVMAAPTEAYAGPVYSDPVVHSETREITFLFPSESAAYLSGPLSPATPHTKGVMEIVGAARVDREEFPELLSAIKETNWPPLAQDRERHMPFTVGEDYSGATSTPTTANRSTIVLDLKFLHKVPEPGVKAHSDETSTWNAAPVRPIGR
jgi:hypothetical protein